MKYFRLVCVVIVVIALQLPVMAQRSRRGGDGSERGGADQRERGGFGRRPGGREGFGGDRGGPGRGPGEGRGPGGMGARWDLNGDGRIDSDELKQLPEGFRNAMESRGIKLKPGSLEDFGNNIRKQFEKRREEEQRRQQLEQSRESDNAPAAEPNRGRYSPPEPFRPRTKERVTVDLPPKYSELDTDFDGQIGLYEWIAARREDLALFDEIDVNPDGLLTPRELQLFDGISESTTPQVAKWQEAYKRPRVTIVGGPSATAGRSGGSGKSYLSDDARRKQEKFASESAFPYVDANKDGRISMEELQRDEKTKRIIPMFEKAGIKVEPMTREQFTAKWIQAQEKFAEMRENSKGKTPGKKDFRR